MKVTTVLAAIYFVQDYVHIYMISLHKQKYFKNGLGLCSYILFLYTNKKALKIIHNLQIKYFNVFSFIIYNSTTFH